MTVLMRWYTNRPYRQAFSAESAVSRLEEKAGMDYDPEIVKTFVDLFHSGAFEDLLTIL